MAKKRKKKSKANQRPEVTVRKLRTNYNLTFDYDKRLQTYIKSLPREHRKIFKEEILQPDGTTKTNWVHQIREVQIGNIMSFLLDNSYPFTLENFLESEMQHLRNLYLERQKRIRKTLKAKAESIEIEDIDWSFMKIPPYDYQKQAVKFMELTEGNMMLGDEAGVGKTAPTFTYAIKNKLKTLIICPASLKLNWKSEIERFSNEKAHIFKYHPGKRSGKVNHPKDESLFHIINFESLKTFIKLEYKHKCTGTIFHEGKQKRCGCEIESIKKKISECPECATPNSFRTRIKGLKYIITKKEEYLDPEDYDLLVIDEFHRIKDKKTDWTQIINRAFRDVVPKKVLLSGTAIKSRPIEIFMPLNLIDKERWNSYHDFGVKYAAAFEDTFGWTYDGASNLEELYERISPIYLRRLKRDVLKELPPKTYTEIELELTTTKQREYNKLEDETVKFINEFGEEEEKEKSFLAKVHDLKKFTEEYKLEKAREFVDDIIDNNDKVVIFFDYIDTGTMIKELWGKKAVIHTGQMSATKKHEAVEAFQNNKKINIFGGTIASAGVGLTLTSANKLIFIGQPWTPSDRSQAEDRIHRASTTHDNVQIITFLCEGTIDTLIYDLLKEKSQVVSKVLDNKDYQHTATRSDESIISQLMQKLQ